MRSGDHVTIHLAYKPEVGMAGEWPWATAVDAGEGGGTYRLENFLMGTPLVVGDLVRCELGADSSLHVVEISALMPGVLLGLTHPEGTEATVRPVLQELDGAGFAVNRPADGYVQVWADAVPPHLARDLLQRDWPDGWEIVERLDTVGRIRQIDDDVDVAPAPRASAPEEDTGYWAAEDPAWQRHGVSDPDTLARLQVLAVEDPRILATIRVGRHADVLEYMSRIAVRDPRLLPPLTRPLLVDPPDA